MYSFPFGFYWSITGCELPISSKSRLPVPAAAPEGQGYRQLGAGLYGLGGRKGNSVLFLRETLATMILTAIVVLSSLEHL